MSSTTGLRRDSPSDADPAAGSPWALAWNDKEGLRTLSTLAEIEAAHGASDRLWIDFEAPSRELLLALSTILALHPLVTEDILERNQRAKVEQTGTELHMVLFALRYEGEIVSHELDIVLGQRFLLTSHDPDVDLRSGTFARRDPGGHLSGGADYLLWALADWVVDGYFPVFDRLGDEIDDLQLT